MRNESAYIDLDNINEPGVLPWLKKNAATFGWTWEFDFEPWHIIYTLGDNLPDVVHYL